MAAQILLGGTPSPLTESLYQRLHGSFKVDRATNATSVRQKILYSKYSIVIIGMQISTEERLKLIKDCKSLSPSTRIFAFFPSAPVQERIRTLDAGADDFLVHPFDLEEFTIKVKKLVQRAGAVDQEVPTYAGDLELHHSNGQIFCRGRNLDLLRSEHQLLSMMILQFGKPVEKDLIERTLGGDLDALTSNNVEQRVSRLRKLLDRAESTVSIRTLRLVGYMLERAKKDMSSIIWLVVALGASASKETLCAFYEISPDLIAAVAT